MATITPFFIDSFGHAYYTVTLGNGMYSAIGGSPDGTNLTVRGNSGWSLRTDQTAAEYVSFSSLTSRLNAFTFYVYFASSLPAEDVVLLQMSNANGNGRLVFDQSEGKFGVDIGSGAATAFGGPALSADTWYRVTWEFDTTTGTASCKATVDGTTEFSTTRSQTAADQTAWFLGKVFAIAAARTILFSALAWSITDGDYETMAAWASHDIQDLHPASDGTHTITSSGNFADDDSGGNNFSSASTTIYQVVDQEPFSATPGANDALWQLFNDAGYAEVVFENGAATADIDAVKAIFTNVDNSSVGSSNADMTMRTSGGTEIVRLTGGTSLQANMDSGTNPGFVRPLMAPPGGTWDAAEIDGLRFRFGGGDGAPDTAVWNYMIDVLSHTDPAASTTEFFPVLVGV